MKSRHSLYLDDALNKRLDELASKPGASRSAIVRDAVSAYLARQGAGELEIAFRERLDRMSGQLNRIEHIQNITLECVALFVRYQLGLSPQLAPADQRVVQALGKERFLEFVAQVRARIADGRSASADVIDRATEMAVAHREAAE